MSQFSSDGSRSPDTAAPGHAPGGAAPATSERDERLWAVLAHASIPILAFVGLLVAHRLHRDRGSWLGDSVAEALNFSLLCTVALLAALAVPLVGPILVGLVWMAALVLGTSARWPPTATRPTATPSTCDW